MSKFDNGPRRMSNGGDPLAQSGNALRRGSLSSNKDSNGMPSLHINTHDSASNGSSMDTASTPISRGIAAARAEVATKSQSLSRRSSIVSMNDREAAAADTRASAASVNAFAGNNRAEDVDSILGGARAAKGRLEPIMQTPAPVSRIGSTSLPPKTPLNSSQATEAVVKAVIAREVEQRLKAVESLAAQQGQALNQQAGSLRQMAEGQTVLSSELAQVRADSLAAIAEGSEQASAQIATIEAKMASREDVEKFNQELGAKVTSVEAKAEAGAAAARDAALAAIEHSEQALRSDMEQAQVKADDKVTALQAQVTSLAENVGEIDSATSKLVSKVAAIGDEMQDVRAGNESAIQALSSDVDTKMQQAQRAMDETRTEIQAQVEHSAEELRNETRVTLEQSKSETENMMGAARQFVDQVQAKVTSSTETLRGEIAAAAQQVEARALAQTQELNQKLSQALNVERTERQEGIDAVKHEAQESLRNTATQLESQTQDAIAQAKSDMQTRILEGIDEAKEAATDAVAQAKDDLRGEVSQARDFASSRIDTLAARVGRHDASIAEMEEGLESARKSNSEGIARVQSQTTSAMAALSDGLHAELTEYKAEVSAEFQAIREAQAQSDAAHLASVRELEIMFNQFKADIPFDMEAMNRTFTSKVNEFIGELQETKDEVREAIYDNGETREKIINFILGLKGHLIQNTVEFNTYIRNLDPIDNLRLELGLRLKGWTAMQGDVESLYPMSGEFMQDILAQTAQALQEVNTNAPASGVSEEAIQQMQEYVKEIRSAYPDLFGTNKPAQNENGSPISTPAAAAAVNDSESREDQESHEEGEGDITVSTVVGDHVRNLNASFNSHGTVALSDAEPQSPFAAHYGNLVLSPLHIAEPDQMAAAGANAALLVVDF